MRTLMGNGMAFDSMRNGSNTVLLVHSDTTDTSTTFTDSSGNGHTLTAQGNAQHTTDAMKWGKTSIQTAAAGDYISIPDSANWNMGSGAFTIDFWNYHTTAATPEFFSQQQSSPNLEDAVYSYDGGTSATFRIRSADSALAVANFSHAAFSANIWYHIAFIRGWGGSANNLACCINGVQQGATFDITGVSWPELTGTFNIGSYYYDGAWVSGEKELDEFRVVKGEAMWTNQFIPPAGPYS